jgi:DNA-directed RNA polymerase specialized sigma24 family protein
VTTSHTQWPALSSHYHDQYGPIDLNVYEAAKEIWPAAEAFGEFTLRDQAAAFDLMLNATAKVTARIAAGGQEIENIKPYLFQTYKHLVASEKAKRLRRAQPLTDSDESLAVDIVADLERKIMLRELFTHMNENERALSLYLMFGYTYEEIGAAIGESAEALRKRFSRLRQKIVTILTPAGSAHGG